MSQRLAWQEQDLLHRIALLKQDRNDALELNDDLKAARLSQNDVDFLELLLMQKLGLVPEGYKKVVFISKGVS